MSKQLAIVLAAVLLTGTAVRAEQDYAAPQRMAVPAQLILDRSAQCDFVPTQAFFLVDFGAERILKIPAAVMVSHGAAAADQPGKWYFGAALAVPAGVTMLQHALLVHGDGGALLFMPPRILSLTEDNLFDGSVDKLREHLGQRKKALDSWRVQLRVQQDSLERLRADAEVIGNVGRIAERAEELQHARAQIGDLDKDMTNLQSFLRLASKGMEPKNFVRRHYSLVQQLDELVRAARDMESGEQARKTKGESEIGRDLKLIESTRNDDYDALREELAKLRKERMSMEEKYMRGASRANDDYQAP